jgi:hypothetical protein
MSYVLRGLLAGGVYQECLERMGLSQPRGIAPRLYANLVRGALRETA